MTEQNEPSTLPNSHLAPEDRVTQNELICDRLLGWRKNTYQHPDSSIAFTGWEDDDRSTPSFTAWAEAGLIIDRFEELAPVERVDSVSYSSCAEQQMLNLSKLLRVGKLRPADVRAAALEYIKAVKT